MSKLGGKAIHDTDVLPRGWKIARLGDVCRIISGSTPKTENPNYWDGEITWVTPTDLGRLSTPNIQDSARKISRAGFNSCATEMIPKGSVVMSSRAPIGHLAIAGVPLCTNQGCKSFVPLPGLNHSYLYFALMFAMPAIRSMGSGTTFAEVSKSKLEAFTIPLPSLAEQIHIASTLREQVKLVDWGRTAAEEQLQAARELPAAFLRAVFESSEAQTWQLKRLGDVASTCSGSTPSRSEPDYYKGNIPWVKTGELRDGLIGDTAEHVSEVAVQESRLKLLPPGTLLVAMYGQGQTRGRTGLLTVSATTNQACFAILPRPAEFDSTFVQLWFRYSYDRLRKSTEGRGGNQPNLNGEILRNESLPFPPLDVQRQLVCQVNAQITEAATIIARLEDRLQAINAITAELMACAFRGDLLRTCYRQPNKKKQPSPAERITPARPGIKRERPESVLPEYDRVRASLLAYFTDKQSGEKYYGRTKEVKLLNLATTHVGLPLGGEWVRGKFGPYDASIRGMERFCKANGWFSFGRREKGRSTVPYQRGNRIGEGVEAARILLGEKQAEMDRVIGLFAPLNKELTELMATAHSAWNDLLLDGKTPIDDEIVQEVRENWHPSKQRFSPARITAALDWLRENGLTPRGVGPRTKAFPQTAEADTE